MLPETHERLSLCSSQIFLWRATSGTVGLLAFICLPDFTVTSAGEEIKSLHHPAEQHLEQVPLEITRPLLALLAR